MTNLDDKNPEISKIYQSYIREEIFHPNTIKNKKRLKSYFAEKPSFLAAPILVPALCSLALVIALIFQIGPFHSISQTPAKIPVLTKIVQTPRIESPMNHISVMNVESKIGPTMVYQKMYNDVFITVVWVFPGGN